MRVAVILFHQFFRRQVILLFLGQYGLLARRNIHATFEKFFHARNLRQDEIPVVSLVLRLLVEADDLVPELLQQLLGLLLQLLCLFVDVVLGLIICYRIVEYQV